jgi:hypothetical protein
MSHRVSGVMLANHTGIVPVRAKYLLNFLISLRLGTLRAGLQTYDRPVRQAVEAKCIFGAV